MAPREHVGPLLLAAVTRQTKRVAMMLARLGRAEEAVAYARQHVTMPAESLGVAQALHERGSLEGALTVAEQGLGLEGRKAELANWLRDTATGMGRSDLALSAALVAFREQQSLADYLHVQELAGAVRSMSSYTRDCLMMLSLPSIRGPRTNWSNAWSMQRLPPNRIGPSRRAAGRRRRS